MDAIKSALFNLGAGRFRNYDSCSWQTQGVGQFRPLKGSSPHIGKHDAIERVNECKVEMVCPNNLIKQVIKKLIEVHPYEEPAYHIIKVCTVSEL